MTIVAWLGEAVNDQKTSEVLETSEV